MGGGSYDYLCFKGPAELMSALESLEAMSARIAGLGYASDAAAETEELIVLIRQALNRIKVRSQRLSGVWQAVEWWDSADSGEDYLKKELEKYRAELEGETK